MAALTGTSFKIDRLILNVIFPGWVILVSESQMEFTVLLILIIEFFLAFFQRIIILYYNFILDPEHRYVEISFNQEFG